MIGKLEMYTLICDNCKESIGETEEFNCWSDESMVEEVTSENGWLKEGDRHYCPKCYSYDDKANLIIT